MRQARLLGDPSQDLTIADELRVECDWNALTDIALKPRANVETRLCLRRQLRS